MQRSGFIVVGAVLGALLLAFLGFTLGCMGAYGAKPIFNGVEFFIAALGGGAGLLVGAAVGGGAAWLFTASQDTGPSQKCPHCAEKIKLEAKICRFCGRNVEEAG